MAYVAVPSLRTEQQDPLHDDIAAGSDFDGDVFFQVGQDPEEEDEDEPLTFRMYPWPVPKALS